MRILRLIFTIAASATAVWACSNDRICTPETAGSIYPDYMDVTVPPNIAPLNFCYTGGNAGNAVTTFNWDGGSIAIKGAKVSWNIRRWRRMLAEARGGTITVHSSVLDTTWTIKVSEDEIDYGLDYRLIEPGYEVHSRMGIYERDLSCFKERALVENTGFSGCVNCHSYNRGDPSAFSLHIRGPHGATLLRRDGRIEAFNTKTDSTIGFCVYPYWHPSGKYIAYSSNATRQGFHVGKDKLIEVFDNASDIQVYDIERNELIIAEQVMADSLWETFPSFSPDGMSLYFCRASRKDIPEDVVNIRYNLCRVSFDPQTGSIGDDVEVLIDAESEGRSISFPRPSYDGKFIMYTLSDYGQFSIWHHEADLWLLDLATGERRRLDAVNSEDTESYHNFSSSSRWFVFSSRRDDGLFTRPYFAHIDGEGKVSKPFMLPQKDPAVFYRDRFLSYNIPEFVTAPVKLDKVRADKLINSDRRKDFRTRQNGR